MTNPFIMNPITNRTLDFLKELRENNTKEWFNAHRDDYDRSHEEVISFVEQVMNLVRSFDKIDDKPAKKVLYRIYRDIRFSKDKTPYKDKWGGYLRRSGEDRRGGLHFDIWPNNQSFIGGGFWAPNKEDLLLIRQQIEADSSPLKNVLESNEFKNYFGEVSGGKLKTGPKGFDREHEDIELLKHKQFLIAHSFTDNEVLAPDFPEQVAQGFQHMIPFLDVMTEYLTTDLNGISTLEKF